MVRVHLESLITNNEINFGIGPVIIKGELTVMINEENLALFNKFFNDRCGKGNGLRLSCMSGFHSELIEIPKMAFPQSTYKLIKSI